MRFSAGNVGGGSIGNRIVGAIIGVPIGIILVFGSCIFLYWNEGRTDYSKVAKESVAVQSSPVSQSVNGKFVSVTGSVNSNPQIGDGEYLKPGPYVAVKRVVEEYAWIEQSQTSNNNTTYTYSEGWTSNPQASNTFHQPQGHTNYQLPIQNIEQEATTGKIGGYYFNPQAIKLPTLSNISLTQSNVVLTNATNQVVSASAAQASATATASGVDPLSKLSLANSQYIYGGNGTLNAPQDGDIRISYQGLSDGTTVTAFGKANDGILSSYTDSHNKTMFDLLVGNRATAIATLHSQYERTLWIFRAIGVGLIWLGLMMLFGPLDLILDFIPIVGEVGNFLILVITFPVALVLGGTVILIGYSFHHPIDLIIAVPVVLIIFIVLFKLIKKARNIPRRGSGAPPPADVGMQPPPAQDSNLFPPTTPQAPQAPPPPTPPPAPPTSGSLFPTNPS